MKIVLRPEVERERLKKLYSLEILDTPDELKFDQITSFVAGICDVESAIISLVDKDRVWFKSRFGFQRTEIPRNISFCDYALHASGPFEVTDTLLDVNFAQSPLVINKPNIRFYASMPLITSDNYRIGSICVFDSKPKKLTLQQIDALKIFAANIVTLIESDSYAKKLSESNKYLDLALEGSNVGIWDWNLKDNSVKYSEQWAHLRGEELKDLKMDLSDWESRVHPEDLADTFDKINKYFEDHTYYFENIHRVKHKNGRWIYILGRGRFSSWDSQRRPTRFTGTDMDITDLMSNRLKLDLFFRHAPYGFAFCDLNGKFKEVNQEFTRITGYLTEELNNLTFWELTPKKYEKDEAIQQQNLELQGSYGPYRKEYIHKSGEFIPVSLYGFKV